MCLVNHGVSHHPTQKPWHEKYNLDWRVEQGFLQAEAGSPHLRGQEAELTDIKDKEGQGGYQSAQGDHYENVLV
jgi:hypothetical protein